MSNSRHIAAVLGILLFLFSFEVRPQTLAEGQSKSAGDVVKLQLIVTDGSNQSVEEFNKNDLKIFESTRELKILNVEPDTRPIDYGIVIDSSGSLRSQFPMVMSLARLMVSAKRTDDAVFLERFVSSDKIRLVQDFTFDTAKALTGLNGFLIEGGQSAVLDGIYVAVDHLAKHSVGNERRKALVLITDGEDRNSFYKLADVIKLLRTSGTQVFAIGLITELDNNNGFIRKSSKEKAEALLKKIAEESGGRLFLPKKQTELIAAVEQITHDLQKQFLVSYQTDQPITAGFHELKVKLTPNDRKLNLITPPGYFVPETKATSQGTN